MEPLFLIIALVGLAATIFGSICIFHEVKDQLREADEIIDKFNRRNGKQNN